MEFFVWCGGNGRGGCDRLELIAGLEANTGGDARGSDGCDRAGRTANNFG